MDNQIINTQLKRYSINTIEDEENALKEIMQEIALYALSTTDFFTKAQFQGGTALRILHQLPRFSEDLDFILGKPDKQFHWEPYIDAIKKVFVLYNIHPEIKDRSKESSTIQKLFLKDNSIGKIINLDFHHHARRKLLIKLEIDTNPPGGSQQEIKYLDFPIDYAINCQDLSSNFAGKCHALLCSAYEKGRDWFDFGWYVSNNTPVNLIFLENAINQQGPWAGKNIKVTNDWIIQSLEEKIATIDWKNAKLEIQRFVNAEYQDSIQLWSQNFFLGKTKKMATYLASAAPQHLS